MSKLNHAWVLAALEQADNERSKITEREKSFTELLQLDKDVLLTIFAQRVRLTI